MNAMVDMPDVGTIKTEHFSGCEKVFSGHFHKRQYNKNVTYIGNLNRGLGHSRRLYVYGFFYRSLIGQFLERKEPVYIRYDCCKFP